MKIEACHCDRTDCPNPLLRIPEWREVVEQWAQAGGLAEKIQARAPGGRLRPHHDFRIVLAGCPNGCSRPPIADVGVVGFVRPSFDPAACLGCGACAEACPDGAIEMRDGKPVLDPAQCQGCKKCFRACEPGGITLSAPAARVLAGGKLGRRPRLAVAVTECGTPEELSAWLDRTVSDFIDRARPGERFADYWARAGKE